jgi:hypothetical protein
MLYKTHDTLLLINSHRFTSSFTYRFAQINTGTLIVIVSFIATTIGTLKVHNIRTY